MILRAALAQINTTVGDLAGNAGKARAAIARAKAEGADIVLLPELTLCGYPPEDLLLRKTFLDDTEKALRETAAAATGIAALIGYARRDGDAIRNSAAMVDDGQVVAVYDKMDLPNYGVFDEKRYFTPGSKPLLFNLGGALCQVTICEDLWVEGGAAETSVFGAKPDVVLNLSASPFHAGKVKDRLAVLSRIADGAGCVVCYTNLAGGQDELVFDGGSMAIGPGGRVIAAARRFEEDLLIVDIEVSPRAGAAKADLTVPLRRPADAKPVEPRTAPDLEGAAEVYAALVLATRDYVRKNGFKKAVLGLSGGIDSALTCAIAVEALGKENVTAVTMPSRFSSEGTKSDAVELAANLGIKLYTVPIVGPLDAFIEALKEPFGDGPLGLEYENLQARIRGNILMALSNKFGWLVLTTGNKSESAVGYCTLYGDTAGAYAVIKDLLKRMVYEVSEHVNAKAGSDVIPRSIFDRPPTAELRPGQKDEDSLPPYPLLDRVLHLYVEQDKGFEEIVAEGFDPEITAEIIKMVDIAEYKRRQVPPGIKITPKAFGRDRRLPITNRYRKSGKD